MESGGIKPEFVFGDFSAPPPPPPPENPFRPTQPHHPNCPFSALDNAGGVTPEVVFRGVTPEVVFRDFRARQKGILKAFTTEVDRFYLKCDTDEEILCLYGFPDETWEVHLPVEEVPPDLPEPTIGINFARDARDDKCWLSRVAAYSDSWLLSLAFFYAARFDFDQESRKRLFSMINSVPTIFEVVKGTDKKQPLRDPPYPAPSRSRRPPPEFVFRDFRARQQGLLKALTTELDRFYLMCDQEKETLCLYGLPNETWKLEFPVEVPPSLPVPTLGINVAPDVNDKVWLSLVAEHSDSWLLSVAFYYAARFGFDQESRKRLFSMINSVPTIFEVVMGTVSKPARQLEPNPRSLPEDKEASDGEQDHKSTPVFVVPSSKIPLPDDKEASDWDEEEDHESTVCGACDETRGVLGLLRLT